MNFKIKMVYILLIVCASHISVMSMEKGMKSEETGSIFSCWTSSTQERDDQMVLLHEELDFYKKNYGAALVFILTKYTGEEKYTRPQLKEDVNVDQSSDNLKRIAAMDSALSNPQFMLDHIAPLASLSDSFQDNFETDSDDSDTGSV